MEDVCRSHPNIEISDVGSKIWEPVFAQCQQLLEQLYSRSMTLSDVDEYFGQYKKQVQVLEEELRRLFHGVNACCWVNKDPSWIQHAVKRMQEYWRLCAYREAANTFLKLRDTLELTKGDFKDVEKISKDVTTYTIYTFMCMLLLCRIFCLCGAILFCRCHLL